jgi:hypothetical protein
MKHPDQAQGVWRAVFSENWNWEDRHQEVFMALMFLLEVEVHFNWMWHLLKDWRAHMHVYLEYVI